MNRLFSFLVFILIVLSVTAQNKPLLIIGDKYYSADEFNYIYNKNKSLTELPVSKEDYLNLFVIYKLKVEEAIAQGYDTVPSFKKELDFYRNELAKPYLSDKKAEDKVIKEAYEHMCYEIEASHILIKLPQSPTPEDTLKAYKHIANVKRQLDEGADFEQMVLKYSEGPSAKQSNGYLGYFTAFMMVYTFEKAAFNTPVGEVSEITRTSFGYHLIKVHNKRKNKGEIKVAHIMKAYPYMASETIQNQSKVAIDSIYQKLQEGASFNTMVAQYSDDKQTVANNGKLPWFGTGQMVPAFSEAAFALTENGQISKPVKTKFGWHIIKRLDIRSVKSLDESREEILKKTRRDERAFAGKRATIERLKEEYGYTINTDDLLKLEQLTIKHSKDELAELVAQLSKAQLKPVNLGERSITSADFANGAFSYSLPAEGINKEDFAHIWTAYVNRMLIDYEKANLEKKYPEFKYLMNEYHDGLLIFEISKKEIWNKASNDSIGLVQFYNQNSKDYTLDEHFSGTLYYCKTKKVSKAVKKMLNKNTNLSKNDLPKELTEQVMIKEGQFFKTEEPLLDKQVWKSKANIVAGDYLYLIKEGQKFERAVQPLEKIKGQVISDYQADLERRWVLQLKEKYKPKLNTFVL